MAEQLFLLLGGVGMFLMGMKVMTGALREAAGSGLQAILTRFTTTPFRGVLTGSLATAVIQSSSATTVMTVGFVGAGLLSMPQALGIIYGANIGTTATGWLVALLGFKLKLGQMAMLLLFPASLADLLGRGWIARLGRMTAGLCLLLIGLDLMQDGMGDLTVLVSPEMLPGASIGGLFLLMLLGMVLTILMQSSSAAMALALVMVESGAISLVQAIAIVAGMNIGTTFTALLASVGGSRPMRQTALANLIFNVATALLAFPVLVTGVDELRLLGREVGAMGALLIFHTGFNLVGASLFLPLTDKFAAFISHLLPEPKSPKLVNLDEALLEHPQTALMAAQAALATIRTKVYAALARGMQKPPDYRLLSALDPCREALTDLERFIADIRLPADSGVQEEAYSALLHQTDHLMRLMGRLTQTERLSVVMNDNMLDRTTTVAAALLMRLSEERSNPADQGRLERFLALFKKRKQRHRKGLLLGEHAGLFDLNEVFARTDALRWLDRVLHHADRVEHYHRTFHAVMPSSLKPRSTE